jgi:aspartate dehydrogenase
MPDLQASKPMDVTLIGFGAIGQSICRRLMGSPHVRVTHVVVRAARVAEVQAALDAMAVAAAPDARGGVAAAEQSRANNAGALAVVEIPFDAKLALECAGHGALASHVIPALARGTECAVLSVGALAELGLPERLADAATQGGTQVHLLSGAIGGIEALAAARLAGLDEVTYTGRKPPSSWAPAPTASTTENVPISEEKKALTSVPITQLAIILKASAREAARLYPKNANVAATIALAGLGLDATQVRLISDPNVTENVHEIYAKGAFGEMKIEMRGKPLADNPKTSALTVLSALRFLNNRASSLTI